MATHEDGDFWGKGGKKKGDKPPAGGEGFWERPGGRPAPEPARSEPVPAEPAPDAAFWNKAEQRKEIDRKLAAMTEDDKARLKKRRRRRRWLIGSGVFVLILLLLVALTPAIVGWIAPGIVESRAGKQIAGSVKIDKTSFGWFGSQRIQNARLLDKDGKTVATFGVEIGKGLSAFVFGNLDVGTVTLRNVKADIIKYPDGTTNLQRAIEPRQAAKPQPTQQPGGKSEPPSIPDSLNVKVIARDMQVTFTDLSRPGASAGTPTVVLDKADLETQLGAGKPVVLAFSGNAAGAQGDAGRIKLDVKAEKLIRSDGVIQADKATIDAAIALTSMPTALADAFVTLPENASVRQALGETLNANITAKGNMEQASVQLAANAGEELRLKGDLAVAGGVLTTPSPLEVFVSGRAVRTLAPQVDAALREQGTATIEVFPSVSLAVSNLKLPIPKDGAPLNLRGAGMQLAAEVGQTSGSVKLAADRGAEPFVIAPLKATVNAPDLAQGAKVTAATTATLGGQPAGDVGVDLNIAGLLDNKGEPVKGPPSSLEGTVAIRRIATAVAQPFLAATPINLPEDIGPTLDVELKAATQTGGVQPGQTPPTDVTIAVTSEGLRVNGGMQLAQTHIRTVGEGLTVQVRNPVGLADGYVKPETGFQLLASAKQGRRQSVVVTVRGLDVPRNAADGAMLLDKAAAQVQVAMVGLVVAPAGLDAAQAQTAALALNNGIIGAELAPGGNAKASVNLAMAYGGAGFTAQGGFDVPGAVVVTNGQAGLAPVERLRPVGQLDIKNVPSKLAGLFMRAEPAAGTEKPLDIAQLLADTLGDKVTVSVATSAAAENAEALNAAVTMRSPTTTADVNASVSRTVLAVQKVALVANVTPQTVSGLMRQFAPDVQGVPRLAGPAKINVNVDPITVPLADYQPRLERAGVVNAKVTIPGRTLVEGLQVANEDGSKRDLGRVGVDSLAITARVPAPALAKGTLPDQRRVTATLAGLVIAQDDTLLELSGNLATEMADGQLAGGLRSDFSLKGINTRLLESIAGKPGVISGAIGNTLTVGLTARLTPPAGAKGQAFDAKNATTNVELTLDAPKLRSDGPLAATIAPAGITLDKPVKMVMDVEPAWLNQFFVKPPPPGTIGGKGPPPDIALTQPTSLTITIGKLRYPMPGGPGGASAIATEAGVSATIPQLQFKTSDGQDIRMKELVVQVDATPVTPQGAAQPMSIVPIALKLDVAEATVGDQPAAKAMTLRGAVNNLLNIDGRVQMNAATVTLNGDLPAIPTALIDALAKQDGLLVDALGPVATVRVQVEEYPLSQDAGPAGEKPPVLVLDAKSQRAQAELLGTIRNNVFYSDMPMRVTITELTEDLAKRLVKGLPLMGTMSKSPKDAPALITGRDLTAPLSNDMSKLNGEFVIDPGEARFVTSTGFAKLLKMGNQRESGLVGQKLRPLNVHVKNGVATYDRWSLPLGEFEVETEGTVDLVKRTIDVVTYVPFASLSENAAGSLNTSLSQVLGAAGGRLVSAATMVPIRTSGPLDNPSTGIDTKAFAENLRKNLKPEDLIKDGLGDLLKDQLKPKNP